MKKGKAKIIGIVLTFAMVIGMMPPISTFAEGNTYILDFSNAASVDGNTAAYRVGEVSVTLTSSKDISADKKAVVGNNDELTLGDSFNKDTMEVVLQRTSDNFEKVLVVDANNKTNVSSGESTLGPDDICYIFVRQKNNQNPPPAGDRTFHVSFGNAAISGNDATYDLGNNVKVTLTSSKDITDNSVTVNENDEFTLSDNFNSGTMEVKVVIGDFSTTLSVDGSKKTKLSNKSCDALPDGSITISIINKSNNPDPENPNNPPQGDLDRVQAGTGQIAINIKNSFCGTVEYSLNDGSGWKEFRGGLIDLNGVSNGTTIKLKAFTSGDVNADIKGDETTIDIDGKIDPIDKNALDNGDFSFVYDSAKAYTIDIVFDYLGDNTGSDFDGTAYIIWRGSKDQTCYHKFENLDPRNDNFVNIKDITDQSISDSTEKFTLDAEYEWVKKKVFEEDWNKANSILKGWYTSEIDEDTLHSYTMNPTTSKYGANSIFNTPDREFRIGFITDDYQAIVVASNEMIYPECPYNDTVFGVPYVDISKTDEEHFAVCEVYLDEPTITFRADEQSKGLKSVKAINAIDAAVKVTEKGDGVFSVNFYSNYYDRVIFEITDILNNKYYLMLARIAISVSDNFAPGVKPEDQALTVDYIYDKNKSYSDFQVVATMVDRDGSQTVELLNPVIVRNQDGSTEQYEVPAGTGLKMCQFNVKCDEDKEIAFFTIIKAGSLSGESFAGAVSGSGEGIMYDIDRREIIY